MSGTKTRERSIEMAGVHARRGGRTGTAASRVVLIVDHRTPDRIYVGGAPVLLQFLQFRLASLLANHPGQCVPYDMVYRELWGSRVVEDGQTYWQLAKLRRAIQTQSGEETFLIRTIPKMGMILDLSGDEVLVIPNQLARVAQTN